MRALDSVEIMALKRMLAELEAMPEDQYLARLNHKAVLGQAVAPLIFTLEELQASEVASQVLIEGLSTAYNQQAAKLKMYDHDRHTERDKRLEAEAGLAHARSQAEEAGAELEACQEECNRYWAERDQLLLDKAELQEAIEAAQERYSRVNEALTEAADEIDRLRNQLHICKHDLGRCD